MCHSYSHCASALWWNYACELWYMQLITMLRTNAYIISELSDRTNSKHNPSSHSLWSCSGQAISILLNLANHISLLTWPVYLLRNVLKNSILNIKIMQTCCARWLSRPISSWFCEFNSLYVQSGTVVIFLFPLSYFCLSCLLVLPYYVVNKVEYINIWLSPWTQSKVIQCHRQYGI